MRALLASVPHHAGLWHLRVPRRLALPGQLAGQPEARARQEGLCQWRQVGGAWAGRAQQVALQLQLQSSCLLWLQRSWLQRRWPAPAAPTSLHQGSPDALTPHTHGCSYEGLWRAGKAEGPGRYVWAVGNEYDGEWRAGRMHGQGTLKWKSGVAAGERAVLRDTLASKQMAGEKQQLL